MNACDGGDETSRASCEKRTDYDCYISGSIDALSAVCVVLCACRWSESWSVRPMPTSTLYVTHVDTEWVVRSNLPTAACSSAACLPTVIGASSLSHSPADIARAITHQTYQAVNCLRAHCSCHRRCCLPRCLDSQLTASSWPTRYELRQHKCWHAGRRDGVLP